MRFSNRALDRSPGQGGHSDRGQNWVWPANFGAALLLAVGGLVLVARIAAFMAGADEDLDYEALGFARVFGAVGIILLAPFVLGAIVAAVSAVARSRIAFVGNIVVGTIGVLVARGFGALQVLMVIPLSAVALGVVGAIVASGRRAA